MSQNTVGDHRPLDAHKLAAARLWATDRFPYLASAIFAQPFAAAPGLGRVVIDQWWRVHADPAVVDGASVADLGGELVHLTGHVLREHGDRAGAVGLTESAELHHWVDAADAEINDDFPSDLARLSPTVTPDDLDAQPGRLAEEYYRQGSVRDGSTNDCGSGAHGQPPLWEPPSDGGVDRRDQQLLRRRVASEIADADRSAVSESLRSWAEGQLSATVRWERELAAVLRRAISSVSGAVDYSYQRPSRRASSASGVVLPALRRPVTEVAVVVDTSASVDDDLLARAVGEVDGLLRATGVRGARILACDDAVRATTRSSSTRDLVLLGGGGTDMGIGLGAATDHRPQPDVIVVLTDGYTPWPALAPAKVDVVVGLLATDEAIAPPTPPDWCRVVPIAR